ncbi:MAG: DnaJ C-terminal domain-containing protein [Alphaproteobacteria bacterium]|nr:DnaJ C-terminal domain-containing protein [Alphaproteobacteria bacterium]
MKDPYKTLGLSTSASQDEIKKTFRKLAKENHPDLNPNKPDVEKRFKEVNAAYEILSDPIKRKKFDAGQIDAEGHDVHPGFKGHSGFDPFASQRAGSSQGGSRGSDSFSFDNNFDSSNFFSDLFGWSNKRKQAPQKGDDIQYTLKLPFLESIKGAKKRVSMPNGRALNITIQPGTKNGQILRLKGQGDASALGGVSGDALVEIVVEDDPYFSRLGNDIHLNLPITLQEAILGAVVTIPTISGNVNLKIPAGSNTGSKLRLKNKGIEVAANIFGDQIVELKVVLPDQPDKDLKEFIEKWAPKNVYNVRGDLA